MSTRRREKAWLHRHFWHSERLDVMSSLEQAAESDGSTAAAASRLRVRHQRARMRAKRADLDGRATAANSSSPGLRVWRKPSFRPEDVVLVEQACAEAELRLSTVHLLTADRQQTVPLLLLRLWPSRIRLTIERHSRSLFIFANPQRTSAFWNWL